VSKYLVKLKTKKYSTSSSSQFFDLNIHKKDQHLINVYNKQLIHVFSCGKHLLKFLNNTLYIINYTSKSFLANLENMYFRQFKYLKFRNKNLDKEILQILRKIISRLL